jgi:hypothetical protein
MSGNLFDHFGVPGEAGATSRVGEPLVSNTLSMATRKGADAVRAIGRADVEANDLSPARMSGLAPIEDVQGMATSALDKARREALAAYSNDAASVTADKRPFDFQPIEAALPDPATARTFEGIRLTDIPRLRTKLDEIIGKVKASDLAAQTPQRMDELKRAVAALREWNLPRSPALAGQAMKGSESSGFPARLSGIAHPALSFLAVPRVVGEGGYGGGSMMRRVDEMGVTPERTSAVPSRAYQTGRAAGGAAPAAPGLRIFGGNSSADPESPLLAAACALRTANERLAVGRR